ncbi:MAG: hypothetical protein JXB49_35825 [Bacteroidales bacterium]|nr:hypothetical protein [Bacteroidales bacterium]
MNKLLVFVLFFAFLPGFCLVQEPPKYIQDEITIRLPEEKKIEEYKKEKEFIYDISVKSAENFFMRMVQWILFFWRNVIRTSRYFPLIKYLIFAALIILVVMQLTKTRLSGLFYKHMNRPSISITELDMNLDNEELENRIKNEINAGNYRMALRFLYIKLLKILTAYDHIIWKKGKTDYDYFTELASTAYQEPFKKLSIIYEYTWYGNFKPKENHFSRIYDEFNQIFSQVNAKAQ